LPIVFDLKQTSVEDEQPDNAEIFLIHRVRSSIVSQRKVYERFLHLTTNCVSSKGPTNSMEEYGMHVEAPVGCAAPAGQ
jgi:hypothetical protein